MCSGWLWLGVEEGYCRPCSWGCLHGDTGWSEHWLAGDMGSAIQLMLVCIEPPQPVSRQSQLPVLPLVRAVHLWGGCQGMDDTSRSNNQLSLGMCEEA